MKDAFCYSVLFHNQTSFVIRIAEHMALSNGQRSVFVAFSHNAPHLTIKSKALTIAKIPDDCIMNIH